MPRISIASGRETPVLSDEAIRAVALEIVKLAIPELAPGGRTLAYVLPQTARIGHSGFETQIISTLFEDDYDRILIFTDLMSWSGTNPWIRNCTSPKIRFIEIDNFDALVLGTKDAGFHRIGNLDCLFAGPRSIFIRFYRHVLAGGAVKFLELPEEAESIARETLSAHEIDPDAPFVFFHNRTLAYVPGMTYHAYRTAKVETYQPSIRRLIEAGYRVIRIGEPGLDTMGFPPDAYVNFPDWGEVDRAVDLFVLARNAFGLAQNSGPIWVAGSAEPMRYRQILDAGIPAILFSDKIAEAGYEVRDTSPDELLAATEEMLDCMAGTWQRDVETDTAFRALRAEYEARIAADPDMQASNFAFYGYAHPFGSIARVTLKAQPGFLD